MLVRCRAAEAIGAAQRRLPERCRSALKRRFREGQGALAGEGRSSATGLSSRKLAGALTT
jgi:hypothetical protein